MSDQYLDPVSCLLACTMLRSVSSSLQREIILLTSVSVPESIKSGSGISLAQNLHARIRQLRAANSDLEQFCDSLQAVHREYTRTEQLASALIPSFFSGSDAEDGPYRENSSDSRRDSQTASADGDQSDAAAKTDETGYAVHGPAAKTDASVLRSDCQEMPGISHRAQADFKAGQAELYDRHTWGETILTGDVLSAGAGLSGVISLSNEPDGRAAAEISTKAEIHAEAAGLSGKQKIGTDDWHVYSTSKASVLGASSGASAGFRLNKQRTASLSAGAEAEAYLVKGEVAVGHSLHGVKIELNGEGMIGLQAEVKGKISTAGISGKVGLGPFGAGIKIDWSDASWPDQPSSAEIQSETKTK